jgi:hypothetical protein
MAHDHPHDPHDPHDHPHEGIVHVEEGPPSHYQLMEIALRELLIEKGMFTPEENTPKLHNMIVCTLCSCYPRMLLGLPPAWYKGIAYRSRAVREPRAVLAEFGMMLRYDVELRVHDSTADMRYMVLPMRPEGTEGWSEEALAALVTRDSLIGVAQALPASSVSV